MASAQFWHGVEVILGAECVVGCNPLAASSFFPAAVRCWGMLELHFCSASVACYVLYADPVASRAVSNGPVLERRHLVGMTRASNLGPAGEVSALLTDRGHVLAVFKRGTGASRSLGPVLVRLARRSRRRCVEQMRAELKSRLDSMRLSTGLTEDGVMSPDLDDPSARETALGPAGAAYRHKGVTVDTAGACKSNAVSRLWVPPSFLRIAAYRQRLRECRCA